MTFVQFIALHKTVRTPNYKINKQIRAKEVRLLDADDNNLGTFPVDEALKMAEAAGLDLVEIAPLANPPVAKIVEFGKFLYEQNKKAKKSKAGSKPSETKSIQIKVGTGDHDLALKAKTASTWLSEGHRVKVELFLSGRTKFMDEKFLKERLDRVLRFITVNYKTGDGVTKSPKGYTVTLERDTKKQ